MLSAPTYLHSLEPDRFMFTTPLLHEKLRDPADGEMFPSVATLCARIPKTRKKYNLNKSKKLNALPESEEKRRPEQLRINIANSFDSRADYPFEYKTSHSRSMETWGPRLPFYYRELNKGIKRIFGKTTWYEKPEEYVPPSFYTRRRDNINCPRDPKLFKASYHPQTFSDLPASTRSFHLEYLHRSLNSRNKQALMNRPNANLSCSHCNEIATLSHVLNDCFIAQLIKHCFKAYLDKKEWKNNLIKDDTFLEFFWWEPKIWSHGQYKELWSVWAEARRHTHQCDYHCTFLFYKQFYKFTF